MNHEASLIGVISYSAGAFAFLFLSGVFARAKAKTLPLIAILVASLVTTAWCGSTALALWTGIDLQRLTDVLEQGRTIAWIVFLWTLLTVASTKPVTPQVRRIGRLLGVGLTVVLAIEVFQPLPPDRFPTVYNLLRLILVVAGFALIENLVRNAATAQRWGIKFLCIGLGGIFTYELFYYADALLFRSPNESLHLARGAIQALVVPLLLISSLRSDMWETRFSISHKTAVYSTALIASGLYLLLMSAAAFYIRFAGGSWGPVIQATFLFGGLVLLAIILASGSVRAYLKVLITKHFFEYKYDYREEWIRFMRTVSENREASRLELRVIRALADTVESPAGALWLHVPGRYAVESTWNMVATSFEDWELSSLNAFVAEKEWIVDIAEQAKRPSANPDLILPEALRQLRDAWILIPLVHRDAMLGFVVLAPPRASRKLTWEDYDLLRLLARQSASYLAEQRAVRELVEARQFEKFNRRAAFVMHDLKNILSELSVLSTNIEKHGDNPAFRSDMMSMMSEAVSKMRRLMARMHSEGEPETRDGPVAIKPLLDRFVAVEQRPSIRIHCDARSRNLAVRADRDRLSAMLGHLVQNATDASGEDGWVRIVLSRQGGAAVVEITDNGPGMDPEFIRSELFKPFHSTKEEGFGIGAFQCRQYARELGGDVEVISSPGSGTTMRLTLPVAGEPVAAEPVELVGDL